MQHPSKNDNIAETIFAILTFTFWNNQNYMWQHQKSQNENIKQKPITCCNSINHLLQHPKKKSLHHLKSAPTARGQPAHGAACRGDRGLANGEGRPNGRGACAGAVRGRGAARFPGGIVVELIAGRSCKAAKRRGGGSIRSRRTRRSHSRKEL
jgi:hypothetical protein